jgi:hypothetical protein
MLRLGVIVVAALFVCSGIVITLSGMGPRGWQLLAIGIPVLIGTLFERWRYRRAEHAVGNQWQRTGERFLDPATGEPIEVYFDPRTGERRYVSEKETRPGEPVREPGERH